MIDQFGEARRLPITPDGGQNFGTAGAYGMLLFVESRDLVRHRVNWRLPGKEYGAHGNGLQRAAADGIFALPSD